MKTLIKRAAIGGLLMMIGLGVWIALRTDPVPVDLVSVVRAPLAVSIAEEGETRVREVYTVSAPIAGRLDRTALDPGDQVIADQTVIAAIHPLDPPLLDARSIAELTAALSSARSAIALAAAERSRAVSARELARHDYERAAQLVIPSTISASELERAWNERQLAEAAVQSADAAIRLRRAELARVQASLLGAPAANESSANPERCCVQIRSPVDGVVLSMHTSSEQVVVPGQAIAEIGDPTDLEVRVDVLSRDAARLVTGAPVTLDNWGGETTLSGQVLLIEPAAFKRVSALGIEEQRVNVIVALDRVPATLGHGFGVYARLNVWSTPDALQVPISALFRDEGAWATFVADDDRARLQPLVIGHMNDTRAEVLDGLVEGDRVIPYPSDLIEPGSLIEDRARTSLR